VGDNQRESVHGQENFRCRVAWRSSEWGGTVSFGSGAFNGPYSYKSRFEDGSGTNPEELIAAAHAACFSMALSLALSQAGHPLRGCIPRQSCSSGLCRTALPSPESIWRPKGRFLASMRRHSNHSHPKQRFTVPFPRRSPPSKSGSRPSWYDGRGSSRITTQPLQSAQKLRLFRSKFRFGENVLLAQVG